MKPITNHLTRGSIKAIPAFILIVFTLILSSCFQHYFRTGTKLSAEGAAILRLQNSNKYFILHCGDNKIYGFTNVLISPTEIEGKLVELPPEHSKYLTPFVGMANRVKKSDKEAALLEVHLYTTFSPGDSIQLLLPLTSFKRVDVYSFDKKKTTGNHILSVVGIILGAPVVIAAILSIGGHNSPPPPPPTSTGCNCPQVYVNHNGLYEFKSGVYSGAVYSALERTDYLALSGITPVDSMYQLRIANAPNEEQFINQVQLMKVEHPADLNVLTDRHGKILTYKKTISPASAKYDDVNDVTAQLKSTDQQYYSFESKANADGFSSVTMKFNKPSGAKKGKLLVHAGNSNWSGYVFKEFVSLFGENYEKWRLQQESAAPTTAQQWQVDQGLPMKVFIETENGWEYVDHFALTGNTASRDMIMEIDLSHVTKDKVNIRIESIFQFWNLDMAALDFSDNAAVTSVILNPAVVMKNNKEDNRSQLLQKDAVYTHLTNKDYISLEYNVTTTSETSSFFLVSSGYYHTMPPTSGKTDQQALLQFKEKGAFDRFSRSKFEIAQETLVKTKK